MLSTAQVIHRLFAEAATGDVERVLSWWAPDGVLEDITIGKAYHGHAELAPYLDMYYRAFPDLDFSPLRILVDGTDAMVEWALGCTFAGRFEDIEPTGQRLFLRAVDVFHIEDGLVQHEVSWYGDWLLRARLEAKNPALPTPLPLLPR